MQDPGDYPSRWGESVSYKMATVGRKTDRRRRRGVVGGQFAAKGCLTSLRLATTSAALGSPATARAIASFVA